MELAQLAEQRRPVHLGHDHIGDDEIDRLLALLDDLQRLDAGGRLEHRVAARRQRPRVDGADGILVLDEEDDALAGEVGRRASSTSGSARISSSSAVGMWRGRKIRKVVPCPTPEST